MKISDIKCHKCGQDAMQASERGAYLKRISSKGQVVMECFPTCEHKTGNQDDALIHAIIGD